MLSEDLATLNRKGYLKDAFFDYDRADLREDARAALAADAQFLKKYGSAKILVEGHCDERGTEEYNLALGDRRANAAREYLASLGVPSSRVASVSYGKERPFCARRPTPAGRRTGGGTWSSRPSEFRRTVRAGNREPVAVTDPKPLELADESR